MKTRSLQSLLIVQFVALVLICMLVIPMLITWQMSNRIINMTYDRLAEDKVQIVKILKKNYTDGWDREKLQLITGDILRWPLAKIILKDADGKEIHTVKFVSRSGDKKRTQFFLTLDHIVRTETIYDEHNKKIGTAEFYIVPFKYGREAVFLKHFRRNILLYVGFMLILAAIFAYYTTSKIIGPVIATARHAEAISKGDYGSSGCENSAITEIKNLVDSVDRLGMKLDEQEKLRKRMMSDIAHELRTPLTVVRAHLEAFSDGLWEPTQERINLTLAEVDRLSQLIKEIGKLTAIEAAGNGLECELVDFSLLCGKTADSYIPMFEAKGVSLVCNIEKNCKIVADSSKCRQLIENLISNALRYTDRAGTVTVSLKDSENYVILSVKDTGIGIAKKDLQYVFERFYRTDVSRGRESGGMGIGLSVVKAIAAAHNAEIRVESEEGYGSCFTVSFPKTRN